MIEKRAMRQSDMIMGEESGAWKAVDDVEKKTTATKREEKGESNAEGEINLIQYLSA